MRNIYDSVSKPKVERNITNRSGSYDKMIKSNFRSAAFTREPWYLTAARKEKERLAKLESESKEN